VTGIHRVRTDAEHADALAVRTAVFVDEQGVPESLEIDDHEARAAHYVAYVDGEPIGAARSRPAPDDADAVKIERVAVLATHRGDGWGTRLMDAVEADAAADGHERAVLGAQVSAADFYADRGYERVGARFEEAGIPHVRMAKPLDGESQT